MKKMTQFIATALSACMIFSVAGCSAPKNETGDYSRQETVIGVAIYNTEDPEVLAFRNYFKNYLANCFHVSFLYSDSIRSAEDEQAFVKQAAETGAEGIISFISYDLENTVALCEEEQIYYMMGSGTIADEAFEAVKNSPHFLGVIGPSETIERQAGTDMATFFAKQDTEKNASYLIFTGGGSLGNVMHQYRTEAILTCLEKQYGLDCGQSVTRLALSDKPVVLSGRNMTVTLFPGYVSRPEVMMAAKEQITDTDYSFILSVMGLSELYDDIKAARKQQHAGLTMGVIDCFSEVNLNAVQDGCLRYVTGKYSSLVGPSFAAMYDAIHGNADNYKKDGEAFQLTQGFWTADNAKSYEQMYAYAVSDYLNAYSGDDLMSVMKLYTASATFADFRTLTEAYDIESIQARRN